MTELSFSIEIGGAPYVIPEKEPRGLAGIGATRCRLWNSAVLSHPEEGIWRFLHSHLQDNIKLLLDHGIKVDLCTLWCPAHMAEGKTTYYPYTTGAWCWNLDEHGNAYPAGDPRHGQHFADHRPWVTDPPHMSGWYEYGQRLANDLGPYITSFSWGNELGGDTYNPLVHNPARWDEAFNRMWYEGALPFFRGVLDVKPDAFLAGPDADGEDALRRGIIYAYRYVRPPAMRAASYHPYSWGEFPRDSYTRIEKFRAELDSFGTLQMEEWWSECGDDGTGSGPEFLREVLSWSRRPALINWHDRRQFFVGSDYDRGVYTLSDFGHQVAALFDEHNQAERRRAAEST